MLSIVAASFLSADSAMAWMYAMRMWYSAACLAIGIASDFLLRLDLQFADTKKIQTALEWIGSAPHMGSL